MKIFKYIPILRYYNNKKPKVSFDELFQFQTCHFNLESYTKEKVRRINKRNQKHQNQIISLQKGVKKLIERIEKLEKRDNGNI